MKQKIRATLICSRAWKFHWGTSDALLSFLKSLTSWFWKQVYFIRNPGFLKTRAIHSLPLVCHGDSQSPDAHWFYAIIIQAKPSRLRSTGGVRRRKIWLESRGQENVEGCLTSDPGLRVGILPTFQRSGSSLSEVWHKWVLGKVSLKRTPGEVTCPVWWIAPRT